MSVKKQARIEAGYRTITDLAEDLGIQSQRVWYYVSRQKVDEPKHRYRRSRRKYWTLREYREVKRTAVRNPELGIFCQKQRAMKNR